MENNMLSIYVPENVSREVRKRVMHEDDDLNKNLIRVNTSITYKNILPKSHPVAKLSILTWIDRQSDTENLENDGTFTLKDLLKIFEIELENFPHDLIENMAKKTITDAIKIGFVKQLDGDNFKIMSSSSDPTARYEDLKRKWIDYSINQEKDRKSEELRIRLQHKMRQEKLRQQPPLDTFYDRPNS